MGQGHSTPYLQILKQTLAIHGIRVSIADIEMYIEVVKEWNPWFPEEGTFDLDNWKRIRVNVEKAYRQGEKVPIRFWSIWSIIHTLFVAMNEERQIKNLVKESAPSIQNLQIDSREKEAIDADTIRLKDLPNPEPDGSKGKVKVKSEETDNVLLKRVMEKMEDLERKIEDSHVSTRPKPSAPPLHKLMNDLDLSDSEDSDSDSDSVFAFPVVQLPPVQGVAQPNRYEGLQIDDIAKLKKAVAMYGPGSHFVKELLHGYARK